MPQESEKMELFFSSKDAKEMLIGYFPSKILNVVDICMESGSVHLNLGTPERSDALVATQSTYASPVVTGSSTGKSYTSVSNGQNRQANNDVNKPDVQSSQQHQHIMSSAKHDSSPASNQPSAASVPPNVAAQQEGSGPSNATVSQPSNVTIDSTRSESQQKSSSVAAAPAESDKGGEPGKDSKMVAPLSMRVEAELTWKKKHTVHCSLHRSEGKCNLCETPEECQNNYDQEFASGFEKFLRGDQNASLATANNEDVPSDDFLKYIEIHLQVKKCPSPCSKLWKYCIDNELFGSKYFRYAPEGLLIHSSNRQNLVGTVVDTYRGYRNINLNLIGSGGFGKVYEFSDQRAVKEEFKQPLINGSTVLFQRVMGLHHPHVIKVSEYIAGSCNKDGNRCFLSVMSFKNRRDLYKQFTKKELSCVLDYMMKYQNQQKFIFRNYTVLFRHVFEGLCYLKSKRIVHRDIKSSNILVHQTCECQSPLQCMCAGGVTYLLGDMDLFSLEEDSANSTYTPDEWEKVAAHDPAGTIGMKPPESFFRNKNGEQMITHKSDVWSACVTMMNVFISETVNAEAKEQISLLITAATEDTKTATKSVTDSSNLLESSIMTMFESVLEKMGKEQSNSGLVNNEMPDLKTNLTNLNQMLASGKKSLHRSQSFHGGRGKIFKEKNPLAGILTTAYGAQVLHWKCFKQLQHIYGTQLWTVIEPTLDAIVAGIKFVPENRQDATEIVDHLERIPLVDFSDSSREEVSN